MKNPLYVDPSHELKVGVERRLWGFYFIWIKGSIGRAGQCKVDHTHRLQQTHWVLILGAWQQTK